MKIVFISYLNANQDVVLGKRVLELGCGLGLASVAAAALGASSVLLTDLEEQLPVAERSVSANAHLFPTCKVTFAPHAFGSSLAQQPLLWGEGCNAPEIILGADIGYDVWHW